MGAGVGAGLGTGFGGALSIGMIRGSGRRGALRGMPCSESVGVVDGNGVDPGVRAGGSVAGSAGGTDSAGVSGGKYDTVIVTVPPDAMRAPASGLCPITVFGGWNELVSRRTLACSR